MALKVLPENVRSILCASAQINNYKTAVAELVHNSLDAEATSIAIRVHIEENSIQVIDNGYGIRKKDFDALGVKYMTSKLTDLSSLKSMPKCYGYRGEFLANIVEISRNVKIISRHKDGEETWAKTFEKGKKKQLAKITTRPSKGTTVEIKGFLYNLNIQKRGIDPVIELQNIKSFLEQLSIAHNNVSLSLRDDSKNEIVFKIHKKRDVYQTLSILFDIERNIIQELQVEKNQYKIKAFIGKTDMDIGRHWVYVNGRYVQGNTKLHKVINENLKKYLLIKYNKKISKSKNNHNEDDLFKQNIPFYFVFVSCPYIDYHISFTHKQTIVEFRNWEQIKIMLEKLIKFYVGDIGDKENGKIEKKPINEKPKDHGSKDAEDKIKDIINKILGSNSKKLGVSQMQNGIKGKLVNRRKKKKKDTSVAKTLPEKGKEITNQDQHAKSQDKSKQGFDFVTPKSISKKYASPLNNEDKSMIYIDFNKSSEKRIKTPNNLNNNEISSVADINKPRTKDNLENPCPNNKIKTSKIKKNKNKKQKKSKIKYSSKVTKSHNCQILSKNNDVCQNNIQYLHTSQYFRDVYSKFNQQRIRELYPKEKPQIDNHIIHSKNKDANSGDTISMWPRNQYHNNCEKCKPQKTHNYNFTKKCIRPKSNPFKTTYDLVQTILESQCERKLYQVDYSAEVHFRDYPTLDRQVETLSRTIISTPIKPNLSKNNIISELTTTYNKQRQETKNNITSGSLEYQDFNLSASRLDSIHGFDYQYSSSDTMMPVETEHQSLRCEDIFEENSDMLNPQNRTSLYSPNIPTYESHKYNQYVFGYTNKVQTYKNIHQHANKTHKTRFITKQSRDNFTLNDKYKSLHKKHLKGKNIKLFNKRTNYYSKGIKQTVDESYTIEFTKSSGINCSIKYSTKLVSNHPDVPHINDKTQSLYRYNTSSLNYEPTSGFGSTYTLPVYSPPPDCNMYYSQNQVQYTNSDQQFVTNSTYYSSTEKQNCYSNNVININETCENEDEANIIFVSKPEIHEKQHSIHSDIQPMEVCETVISADENIEDEYFTHFNDNNHRIDEMDNQHFKDAQNNDDILKYYTQIIKRQTCNENVSHHFSNTLTSRDLNMIDNIEAYLQKSAALNESLKENNGNIEQDIQQNNIWACNDTIKKTTLNIDYNNFDFKDRLRFLPKGMSQIFENCGSKTVCDYKLDTDYYEDLIYNDFANNVQMQAEVYEPVIQNAEDLTTKNIHTFENKVHKDNSSLVFDESSLKGVKVLNQIDCKFIATIMKEKHRKSEISSEYLVLFDQHAVHERIKLEQNLADYFVDNNWKSVPLKITLKMTKDEILYLHNYKDKFNQLGLQWTILNNCEISLTGIPEAILGKNPREVDKVMKAVKNLIAEQIAVIKLQKGCISLYPKSIMDLVFSEACRYAIKFGDKLTKNDCIDLLNSLSNCKTPFQCAHGRPVMAVLVEIKSETRHYKLNPESLKQFKMSRRP